MPKLSDYTKVKKLGEGAFGEAWSVRKKGTTRLSCLKSVDMSKLDEKGQELQRNESVNLAKVRSPYVIQLYSTFEEGDILYIETEFCEGGGLDNVIKVLTFLFLFFDSYSFFLFEESDKSKETTS